MKQHSFTADVYDDREETFQVMRVGCLRKWRCNKNNKVAVWNRIGICREVCSCEDAQDRESKLPF